MRKIIGCLLSIALLSGCVKEPLSIYPDFPQKRGDVKRVVVMCDVLLARDVLGTIDAVDLMENAAAGKVILDEAVLKLREHGFDVVRTVPSSVGIDLAGVDVSYKVVGKSPGKEEDLMKPPFYVDEEFARDPKRPRAWADLVYALLSQRKNGEKKSPVSGLGPLVQDEDGIVVVTTQGRHVALVKTIAEGVLTVFLTAITFGIGIAAWSQSAGSLQINIINARTGEVVWSDSSGRGYCSEEEKVRSLTDSVLDRLP